MKSTALDIDPEVDSWIESGRQLRLARRLVWMAVLVCAAYVPIDLFVTGYHLHAVLEALACAGLFFILRLMRQERLELAQYLGVITAYALVLVVIMTSPVGDVAIVWAMVFPPLPFFLFGIERGLRLSLAGGAGLIGLLVIAKLNGWAPDFSWVAVPSTLGAFAASTALGYLYEQSRSRAALQLVAAANTDALTGLANRRGFLAGFWCRRAIAVRTGQPLALLVLDIDAMKGINDTLGHTAGDAALRHVASVVKAVVREQDLIGRVGGDEFALLLPNTDRPGAEALAAKLRARLSDEPLRWPDDRSSAIPVRVSIGWAAGEGASIDFDGLFAEADRLLYVDKEGAYASRHSPS